MRRQLAHVTAVLILSLASSPASAAPAAPAPFVFTALTPDGAPARSAVAVATVLSDLTAGERWQPSYTFYPSPTGTFTIEVPPTDPSIASRLPQQKVFNVRVTVYQFPPGLQTGRPTAVAFLDHVLNFGDVSVPDDVAGLQGETVRLTPVPPATTADAEPVPDASVCQQVNPVVPQLPGYYTCVIVSYPLSTRNEQVVIAHNIGSGAEMETSLQVQNAFGISTTTVSGISGLFVESSGSATVSEQVNQAWTFVGESVAGGGGPPNEDAALLIDFAQVDKYDCLLATCTMTTTFLPYQIAGVPSGGQLPTAEPRWHDWASSPMPRGFDCTVGVPDVYTMAQGVNRFEEWTFGFDFQGSYYVFNLHANAVVRSTQSNDYRNSYVWEKTGDTKKFHHIFVHSGLAQATSDAASSCPVNSPGSTYTDASDVNKVNPPSDPTVDAPPVVPPLPDEVRRVRDTAHRCAAAPERCGMGP